MHLFNTFSVYFTFAQERENNLNTTFLPLIFGKIFNFFKGQDPILKVIEAVKLDDINENKFPEKVLTEKFYLPIIIIIIYFCSILKEVLFHFTFFINL